MAQCPKCGVQAQGKFCPNCGGPLDTIAAAAMATPVPPAPPMPTAPYPQQAWPAAPAGAPVRQPAWQGVTALVIGALFFLFIALGVAGNTGDPNFANILLGGKAASAFGAILVVPFGLWSLFKNRTGGKVMGGIGIALILMTLLYVFTL